VPEIIERQDHEKCKEPHASNARIVIASLRAKKIDKVQIFSQRSLMLLFFLYSHTGNTYIALGSRCLMGTSIYKQCF
jgi:hypothetical protein